MASDGPTARSTVGPALLTAALSTFNTHQGIAGRCAAYHDSSPDPFHGTRTTCAALDAAGFTCLDEREIWTGLLKAGGKYYYTRNRSCVVGMTIGGKYEAGNGFKVIGAHLDSPNLRIKPKSKRSGSGCLQLDVECYGGGLWHTWFDRDLSLSGRVLVRTPSGGVAQRLVRIDRPVLRVPTLCIHLQTADEREAFKVNKEDHLQPILALEVKKSLEGNGGGDTSGDAPKDADSEPIWADGQEPLLLGLLATELDVSVEEIVDFEISLHDTQKAAITGAANEFLCSSRLDNQASCFVAVEALIAHANDAAKLDADTDVSLIALFDHEEIGSDSTSGAGSPIMAEAVRRVTTAMAPAKTGATPLDDDVVAAALRNSFVLSVDMAHAIHPNYASKHEKTHAPLMNKGIVIKSNSNQRYASNGLTSFVVRELARRAALSPPQEFVVRNDCPCGSTIGPIISANTGMRAVDVGMPMLSMHSIREMMGVADLTYCLSLFDAFLTDFRAIDDNMESDGVFPLE